MDFKTLTNHLPPLVFLLSETPKEQRLWLRFSSATWVLSFMFGSTRSPKMVSVKGWFSIFFFFVAWWNMCLNLFAQEWNHILTNHQIYRPTTADIWTSGGFFPGSVDPTLWNFCLQKNGVPRSWRAITFLAIPWIVYLQKRSIYSILFLGYFYHYFSHRKKHQ